MVHRETSGFDSLLLRLSEAQGPDRANPWESQNPVVREIWDMITHPRNLGEIEKLLGGDINPRAREVWEAAQIQSRERSEGGA